MLQARLKYDGTAAKIAAAARAAGHEPPEGTVAELWPASQPYYEGYLALESSRSYAGTMGAIFPLGLRYSDVLAYAQAMGEDAEGTGEAIELILAMDKAFLEHDAEKRRRG